HRREASHADQKYSFEPRGAGDRRRAGILAEGGGPESREGTASVRRSEMRPLPFDWRQGQQEGAARRSRFEALVRGPARVDRRRQENDRENQGAAQAGHEELRSP